MFRSWRIIVALTVLTTGSLFSQAQPILVALGQLLANPQHYVGETIAVHAMVDSSNAASGRIKLFEIEKSAAAAKAQTPCLFAALSKDDRIVSPKYGQEVIVIGHIQMQAKTPIFQVVNIISDRDAIHSFLRSSEKKPRPGDNLGHDAQPSRSISE